MASCGKISKYGSDPDLKCERLIMDYTKKAVVTTESNNNSQKKIIYKF